MHYIVYQAYGNDEIAYEALYSILTLYSLFNGRLPANTGLVIYTDRQALFKMWLPGIPVNYHLLTPEKIREWRGQIDFVHRVKIKVLQDFYSHYNGGVLYVDTDTCFIFSPLPALEKIAQGQQMMHTAEYTLADNNKYARKIARQVTKQQFVLADSSLITIAAETRVWNAGAIGLPATAKDLLPDILTLTDELYRAYPKHIMEQLSFSFLLAQHGTIAPLDSCIFHYWNFKEYRNFLREFFDHHRGKNMDELMTLISTIDPSKMIKAKQQYQQLPGWNRALLRLAGRAWKVPHYSVES